jgi:hypothetical protein
MFCIDSSSICTDMNNNLFCVDYNDGSCVDLNQPMTNKICKDPISGTCKDMNFYTTLCKESLVKTCT